MIRSMTGYGSARLDLDDGAVSVEIRSVNGRHLSVRCRLPSGAEELEPALKEWVGERLFRGSVTVSVDAEEGAAAGDLALDHRQVEAYLDAFEELRDRYSLPGQVDLPLLVRAGGLLREVRGEPLEWLTPERLADPVGRALDQLVDMREEEGRKMEEDLRSHLDAIEEGLDRVEARAPERLERERTRLREAVEELLEGEVGSDDERIAREIALLADKWDLGEEVSRARSHVDAFREFLAGPPDEPVGRRLSFLAQELHRELNTTGAKANDARISQIAVEMKNELEGIREQVENVE